MADHAEQTGALVHACKARVGTGPPFFGVTPRFAGELYVDDDSGFAYVAQSATTGDWRAWTKATGLGLDQTLAPVNAGLHWGTPKNWERTRWLYPELSGFRLEEIGAGIPTSGVASGEDTHSSKLITYGAVTYSDTGGFRITLYVCVPEKIRTSSEWGANGIRLLHKFTAVAGSNARLTIEAMDPTTGTSFGTPKTATRNTSGDGSYQWLGLTNTQLNGAYAAGQMLKLVLTFDQLGGAAGNKTVRFATLEFDWQ